MTEQEYYELPYGVGDRIELQQFLMADHFEGITKQEAGKTTSEPLTQQEIYDWMNVVISEQLQY